MIRALLKPITAVENGRIILPPELDTPQVRDQIMDVASRLGPRVVIQKGRQLYAGPVAGVLEAGRLRVQILPKIHDGAGERENAEFLFQLLRAAGQLENRKRAGAHIDAGRVDVLELVLQILARELESLLVRGVPRRYHPLRELSPVVRGRIDLPRLMRQGGLVTHGIPVEHAPLQRDNPLTRLLRALAVRLYGITRSTTTRALLGRADRLLDGAARLSLTPQLVSGVQVGRYEQTWQPFVSFAQQLVRSRAPNPAGSGDFQAFGWIFELQLLFQAVIRRALVQALVGTPLLVEPPATRQHLLTLPGGGSAVAANPDYVLSEPGRHVLIADAKWKTLATGGEAHGLTAADVYQMSAYMSRFDVAHGLLLYPQMSWMPEAWSEKYGFQGTSSSGRQLVLGAVDIRGLVAGGTSAQRAQQQLRDLILASL